MKKLIILLAILIVYSKSNATGIAVTVINHCDQKLVNIGWDNRSMGNDVAEWYQDTLNINNLWSIQKTYSSHGAVGTITFYTNDGKYSMTINYDNPYVGKSSYSATATGPYHAKITSINRKGEPQSIYVEISGGIITAPSAKTANGNPSPTRINIAPPAITTISSSGSNTVKGTITWNEDEVGNPATTDWLNIFQFNCKVPLKFCPDNTSADIYKGRKGNYEGEQKTGQLLFSNYKVTGKIHTLDFILDGIANDVPLIVFDVQVIEKAAWKAPSNNPAPAATGYQYRVVTDIIKSPVQSGNQYVTSFGLFGGWAGDKTDVNPNTGSVGIAGRIQSQKNNIAFPLDAFTKKVTNIRNNNFHLNVEKQKSPQ